MGDRPTALGCHIYSGAFTLGVSEHFDIVGQWEEGPWGAQTFEMNFPDVPHPLTRAEWPIKEARGVNFLYANPPCAPWSVLGQGNSGGRMGATDPRLEFSRTAFKLAKALRPDFFVIESVCPAWTKGRSFYEGAIKWLHELGYATTVFLTNGILHGAPQNRERFHLVAHRYKFDLPEPALTFEEAPIVDSVIGDLVDSAVWNWEVPSLPNHTVREPRDWELTVMRVLRQGEHWRKRALALREDGIEARSSRVTCRRLLGGAPSCTMSDLSYVVHPTVDRMITLREGARLCGYPDDFVFAPKPTDCFLECPEDVTQAVLPAMGRYLGGVFREALALQRPEKAGVFRELDFRPLAKGFGQLAYGRKIGKWPV